MQIGKKICVRIIWYKGTLNRNFKAILNDVFLLALCWGFYLVCSAALGLPPASQVGDFSLCPVEIHLTADLSRHSLQHPSQGELDMSSPWLLTEERPEFPGKSAGELSYFNISHVL